MAHKLGGIEKRRHPRLSKKLPISVKVDDSEIKSQTHDISLSGVYCQVGRYIETMQKIELTMFLPIKGKDGSHDMKKVACKGVVVRSEKSGLDASKYNIALYFIDMKKADTDNISLYIQSHNEELSAWAKSENLSLQN